MYAVKSGCTQGVFREPDRLTSVPEAKSYIKGIMKERDRIIALIDLRDFFGMSTIRQEYEEFNSVIESAEEAHKNWVAELCRCVDGRRNFMMEKNPHNCAFGRWYDKYEAPISTVEERMKKIRQPHYNLHGLGVEYDREMSKEKVDESRLREIAVKAKAIEKQILETMDVARENFKDSYRTMVVELTLAGGNLGLVVDEIVGVEQIGEVFEDSTFEKMERSPLIGGVANTRDGKELIFLIDEEQTSRLLIDVNDQVQGMME